ncbi:hypothetical protein AAE478_007626 [Parahypoxylon ruwenzoriense]
MSVPEKCTVLVIGGGPGGSYTAAVLARESIDVVVLEAEKFPRYHIGESMLPSTRHFLKFIDAYDKWNSYGFQIKNGGGFKLNWSHPETYTDFIAAGGPEGYAWNVIRSESDELLFQHAGSCGAKIFDATKVTAIEFGPSAVANGATKFDGPNPGRPISATWQRKDGSSGVISFDYLVDASGRQGILSTRYLKNRKFNQGLKNIANWGYWKGGGVFAPGTYKEGSPYFEALQDASGWCWFIPLHDGTRSVGIVQNQEMATAKKRAAGSPSSKDFYMQSLNLVPGIKELLSKGELVTEIKSASDWSYSASSYAFPYARIVGDAGSFIDPFFSSGIHLALNGGLSAAVTISASIRGDCDESTAASWHSKRVSESYTRFLLVVMSSSKQIRSQNEPVISDFDEESFERAFDLFRPVIQGTVDADAKKKLTQTEISKTVEFCFRSFTQVPPEQKEALIQKIKSLGIDNADEEQALDVIEAIKKNLTPEESQILDTLRGRKMLRAEDAIHLKNFALDTIDGLAPNMERGKLGLVKATPVKTSKAQLYDVAYLDRANMGIQRGDAASKARPHGTDGRVETNGSMQEDVGGYANEVATEEGNDPDTFPDLNDALAEFAHVGEFLSPHNRQGWLLDPDSRHKLMSSLRKQAEDLETPYETMMRLVNSDRQLALIKIGNNLGIFKALCSSKSGLSTEKLAEMSGAEPRVVTSIMKCMVANRLVARVDENRYAASHVTRLINDVRMKKMMKHFIDFGNPAFKLLPEYLEETGYKVGNTGPDFSAWLKGRPGAPEISQESSSASDPLDWISSSLFSELVSTVFPPRLFIVDIGGSIGASLLATYPILKGRVVIQHHPKAAATGPPIAGINYTAQMVKGVKYYYLRGILNKCNDEEVASILKQIISVMAPDSRIMIDEKVLPYACEHACLAGTSLQTLILHGTIERSETQWMALLEQGGLKLARITPYTRDRKSSIIFAEVN